MLETSHTPARSASKGNERRRAGWRCCFLTVAIALPFAGCRTQPYVNSHIESVNAEYRQLEDYVYVLEEENAKLQQEVESLRTVGVSPASPSGSTSPGRGGLFRRPPAGAAPRRPAPATESTPGFEPPVIEVPGDTPPAPSPSGRSTFRRPLDSAQPTPPADTPPSIELPDRVPLNVKPPGDELLPIPAAPRGTSLPSPPETISPQPADKKVTHLFLGPLSGATDFDGQPGDDGLRIVVEPRNASDQFVSEAGALSVVLLDPDRQGEAARIARWDFDSSAARQILAASSPGGGLKLEVPWPAAAPSASRLKMFVRYETPDGRRLQTDREIFVTQPGQALSRWTPRSTDRQPPAVATAALTDSNESSSAGTPQPLWSPNR